MISSRLITTRWVATSIGCSALPLMITDFATHVPTSFCPSPMSSAPGAGAARALARASIGIRLMVIPPDRGKIGYGLILPSPPYPPLKLIVSPFLFTTPQGGGNGRRKDQFLPPAT